MANLAALLGVDEFKRALRNLGASTASGYQQGLALAALQVERYAKEWVPVDTGVLRASISTIWLSGRGFDAVYVVGANTEYAVYVHENLEINHPYHGDRDCGGVARYLEVAVEIVEPEVLEIIANAIQRAWAGASHHRIPGAGGP